MAFTPVATTDTLETFRTRYNATNITVVDDSSTTVDITLATDSLKLSGGTGIASAISGDTVTFNLSNTGVSAATYGSSTAIPVIAVNAQGQITSASTASVSSDLTIVDDSSTSETITLGSETLKFAGGDGIATAITSGTVTMTNKTLTSPVLNGTLSGTAFLDEDSFSSNSATAVASQQSIKAYVDANSGGASSLNGLSDATVSSSAAGQVLLYDGTDSFDNKAINVMGISGASSAAAFTASLPMMFGAHIFTVSAVNGSSDYTFSGWNADGTTANDPTIYIMAGHTYVFYLAYNSVSHPFAIRTGGSASSGGTNLTSSNGGSNLIHIDTDGTVTTGTSANAKYRGWLIWKVPHFTVNQWANVGDYHYQCTSHAAMFGQFHIFSMQAEGTFSA